MQLQLQRQLRPAGDERRRSAPLSGWGRCCCNAPAAAPRRRSSAPLNTVPRAAADQTTPLDARPPQQQPQQQPPPDTGPRDRSDLVKAVATGGLISVVAAILDHDAVEAHQGLAMSVVFCLGYVGIIAEDLIGFNKAGVALGTAVSLWIIRSTGSSAATVDGEMAAALTQVSELIYFLLGAMTVVEVVDAHGGFKPLAALVNTDGASPAARNTRLLWGVGLVTFFLSAVLDNLTTTLVMLSVLQRTIPEDKELRKLLGAAVVIAANAGGAWTPVGDVTTTMLWLHGQLTPIPTMRDLLLPSLVSMVVPLGLLQLTAPEFKEATDSTTTTTTSSSSSSGSSSREQQQTQQQQQQPAAGRPDLSLALTSSGSGASLDGGSSGSGGGSVDGLSTPSEVLAFEEASSRGPLVLAVGLAALLSVPAFKYLTGLPPYMGMLCGLSVLWLLTDALHFGESRGYPRVSDALRKLDVEAIMFFLGILLAVGALEAAGLLEQLAVELSSAVPNTGVVAGAIGVVSALVDNVPLVAGTMGMYSLERVPPDSQLWQLIALCAGTGGSLLVIGSAAGVAFMSIEGAGFGWYARRITPWVAIGYGAAFASYALLNGLPPDAAV